MAGGTGTPVVGCTAVGVGLGLAARDVSGGSDKPLLPGGTTVSEVAGGIDVCGLPLTVGVCVVVEGGGVLAGGVVDGVRLQQNQRRDHSRVLARTRSIRLEQETAAPNLCSYA